ncbi:hypothetical protein AB0E27_15330 [Streptomyces sparsogenes]|uniref:hypothetical protein n=1 Tax=Streptomyces sparsogenes TaxID=67365 RepID=UPI0033C1574F
MTRKRRCHGRTGPAPKDPTKRRRRNATEPETVLQVDNELRGPELPAGVLSEEDGVPVDWHP